MTRELSPRIASPAAGSLHAVVTGGSSGIGLAIARALATDGCAVSILGRDRARLDAAVQVIGPHAHAFTCDVTDEHAVTRAFADATARGPVQVLVNNAGAVETASLSKTTLAMWRRMLDVNVTSAFLCQQHVLPAMREAGFGRIVNIASTAALKGYAYVAAYSAAKHALLGLTRATAAETVALGITVNAVCPGYTDTPLVARSIERIVEKTGRTVDEAKAALTSSNPQGRLITPDEVAAAVRWLVSPDASSVTGQAIVIAGGEVM
jgi:NAD(P)-dependent dehydrogenase (short-subunit alcohol dehydrogenase family)